MRYTQPKSVPLYSKGCPLVDRFGQILVMEPWPGLFAGKRCILSGMPSNVWFSVLGPVEALWRGRSLRLGTPQQRTVLAVILMNEGAVTSVDEILSAVWADQAPAGGVKTVRTYVSRIRGGLRACDAEIEYVAGGYVLDIGPGSFDVARFRELAALVADARVPAHRAQLAQQALALFRGEPLAGLSGSWVQGQRARLSYLRLAMMETLFEAEILVGRDSSVLAELPGAVREFPFRERLRELHVLALYQSGLRAEAFAAYRETWELLDAELGVQPMPSLQKLHQQMLEGDLDLILRTWTGPEAQHIRVARSSCDSGHSTGVNAMTDG